MKTNNPRACVYPKDVQRIMGKEYKPARLYLKKIKDHYKKAPHQVVSIEEFCEYAGLLPENVRHFLI